MKHRIYLAIAFVSISLLGAGCAPYGAAPTLNENAAQVTLPPPAVQPTPTPIPTPTPTPTPATVSVSIQGFHFSPGTLTVKKGTRVEWTNNDGVPHTVTADLGTGLASSTLNPGDHYTYTFASVGTFDYHCSIHASMHGSVVVTQ